MSVSKGKVVVIANDDKLNFGLSHKARLINIKIYDIFNFEELYGFVCGTLAIDYDVLSLFIDSVLDKGQVNEDELFLKKLNLILEKYNIKVTLTVPILKDKIPENISNIVEIK